MIKINTKDEFSTDYWFLLRIYLKHENELEENVILNRNDKKIIREGIKEYKQFLKKNYGISDIRQFECYFDEFNRLYVECAKYKELISEYLDKLSQINYFGGDILCAIRNMDLDYRYPLIREIMDRHKKNI